MKLVSRLERNVMGRDWGMNYGHGPRMQFELGEMFKERTSEKCLIFCRLLLDSQIISDHP